MNKNIDYITYQVRNNQRIYIDTCSLMDTDRLLKFIDFSKETFIENEKQIIIHSSVMAELAKFACSSNTNKRIKSEKALSVIRNNTDLFSIEECTEKDLEDCFADPKLLVLLFENRDKYKQLLISNDSNLTNDAFNFNNLKSFHGNRINVCYLGTFGSMFTCDCVKQTKVQAEGNNIKIEPDNTSISNITTLNNEEKKLEKINNKTLDAKSFALGSLLTSAGFGLLFIINKVQLKQAR